MLTLLKLNGVVSALPHDCATTRNVTNFLKKEEAIIGPLYVNLVCIHQFVRKLGSVHRDRHDHSQPPPLSHHCLQINKALTYSSNV